MTRLAALDLRRGRYVAHSSSLTADGMWIANGTFQVLDEPADARELGAAVRRMLGASRAGVPTPALRDGPSPFAPVLDALGLRTWATYAKGTRHVDVEQDAGTVVVSPTRNGGAREGFVGLTEHAVRLTDPGDAELGEALRAALDRSR
ncbi:hypothetical protein [Micromonospora narathiwatensis]|uniref:Uncharacterized protein n=1 Tax=Micromonospora narathiwatensis TaxID=299146 RepID=A0A1A8ZQA1_9ACTN|nr:hypothetical protein [Micromonospora narathiwatensis]SBT46039.1 hypothetical protein GA0070621_2504 [Micromonospora narathiwatensis]